MTNIRRLEKLEKSKEYRELRALRLFSVYLASVPKANYAASRAYLLKPNLPELWKQATIADLRAAGEPIEVQPDDDRIMAELLDNTPKGLAKEMVNCGLFPKEEEL